MPGADAEKLYALLTSRPKRRTVRELDTDARRAYLAKAGRGYRQRQRAAQERGSPEPTAPMIRAALADAALMLLACDGPGVGGNQELARQGVRRPGRSSRNGDGQGKVRATEAEASQIDLTCCRFRRRE